MLIVAHQEEPDLTLSFLQEPFPEEVLQAIDSQEVFGQDFRNSSLAVSCMQLLYQGCWGETCPWDHSYSKLQTRPARQIAD